MYSRIVRKFSDKNYKQSTNGNAPLESLQDANRSEGEGVGVVGGNEVCSMIGLFLKTINVTAINCAMLPVPGQTDRQL